VCRTAAGCNYRWDIALYHIFPVNVMFLLRFVGGTNRLLPNPREMQQLFAEMRRKPFHVMPGVNTLFNGLLASGELRKSDFAAARIIMGAGASAQQSVAERWKAATGVPLTEGYGLTECATQSISASGR
jgi:long-chain acyl-CoA synthetase